MAKSFTYKLDRFLGLRISTDGADELEDGQSPDMLNFKITPGYCLKKRDGYQALCHFDGALRGFWQGKIGQKTCFCAVAGQHFWASEEGFESMEIKGDVPGEESVRFFTFGKNLYLLTGLGIYQYDGESYSGLEPYIPTVMIAASPDGSGTLYEEANALTGKMRETFVVSGTDFNYHLVIPDPVTIHEIRLDGKVLDADSYYWNEFYQCITFEHAPVSYFDEEMEVIFEAHTDKETIQKILNCRFAMKFGGANDTRVFLYGSKEDPAMRYHSGIIEGEPRMDYFPASGYTLVGDGSPITAILRHYDRQLIFTEKNAYYSYLEYRTDENGKLISSFPVYPLSDDLGSVPEGQAVLVQNDPCTLTTVGLCRWVSTNIRDERNAKCISEPIAQGLVKEDYSKAVLFNRKTTSELYLCFANKTYVYHYVLGVFYYYETPAIRGFAEIGTKLYFITDYEICRVGGNTDNGKAIPAYWKSKRFDFSASDREKNLYSVQLSTLTEEKESVGLNWLTDREKGEEILLPLERGEASPMEQIFQSRRVRARRFVLLQLILSDTETVPLHLSRLMLTGQITDKKS